MQPLVCVIVNCSLSLDRVLFILATAAIAFCFCCWPQGGQRRVGSSPYKVPNSVPAGRFEKGGIYNPNPAKLFRKRTKGVQGAILWGRGLAMQHLWICRIRRRNYRINLSSRKATIEQFRSWFNWHLIYRPAAFTKRESITTIRAIFSTYLCGSSPLAPLTGTGLHMTSRELQRPLNLRLSLFLNNCSFLDCDTIQTTLSAI